MMATHDNDDRVVDLHEQRRAEALASLVDGEATSDAIDEELGQLVDVVDSAKIALEAIETPPSAISDEHFIDAFWESADAVEPSPTVPRKLGIRPWIPVLLAASIALVAIGVSSVWRSDVTPADPVAVAEATAVPTYAIDDDTPSTLEEALYVQLQNFSAEELGVLDEIAGSASSSYDLGWSNASQLTDDELQADRLMEWMQQEMNGGAGGSS